MEKCKICNNICKSHYSHGHDDNKAIDCTHCGKYIIDECLESELDLHESKLYLVSSWIREKNDQCEKAGINNYPLIGISKFDEILELRKKSIQEKFNIMMNRLSEFKKADEINDLFLTRCWVKDVDELVKIYQKGIDLYFINGEVSGMTDKTFIFHNLTFDGEQYIESLAQPNKSSKKIFVAFHFEEKITSVFENKVKEAIEELGYIYTVVNQDNTNHDQTISDEIIAKIKSCKVLIADFTHQRNSVYFEAGFAMGMKIPIIWTCKEDHIKELSFDTRQFPHIVWTDGDDLKQQIKNRIRVIV